MTGCTQSHTVQGAHQQEAHLPLPAEIGNRISGQTFWTIAERWNSGRNRSNIGEWLQCRLDKPHVAGPGSGAHPARLVARAGGAGHSHDGEGCGCGGQHRPYERSFLFRLDADRHRRDFVIVRGSFGSRAVGAEAEISLPKPAAVLVPPFRSCKPAASDGGTRCRSWGFVQADED